MQTYDQHLGPVNTITFVDENRRFVTTSDDKTIRGWDYDIPVVIKYIAEPYMHSMPAVTLHPSSKCFMHYDQTPLIEALLQNVTLLVNLLIIKSLSTLPTAASVKIRRSASLAILSPVMLVILVSRLMANTFLLVLAVVRWYSGIGRMERL